MAKKPKLGRPKSANPRTEYVSAMVDRQFKKELVQDAASIGMPLSKFVRSILEERPVHYRGVSGGVGGA